MSKGDGNVVTIGQSGEAGALLIALPKQIALAMKYKKGDKLFVWINGVGRMELDKVKGDSDGN